MAIDWGNIPHFQTDLNDWRFIKQRILFENGHDQVLHMLDVVAHCDWNLCFELEPQCL